MVSYNWYQKNQESLHTKLPQLWNKDFLQKWKKKDQQSFLDYSKVEHVNTQSSAKVERKKRSQVIQESSSKEQHQVVKDWITTAHQVKHQSQRAKDTSSID